MKVRYTRTRSLGGFRGGFQGNDAPTVTEQKVVQLPSSVTEAPQGTETVPDDMPVSDWTEVGGTE